MSVELIDARPHSLRLIQPTSQRASEGPTFTLLGKTFGFTVLPLSPLPASPDYVEGDYTLRIDDSGEGTLTFPNAASSKGRWLGLFNPDLALQFVEIKRDGRVEFVGSVQRVDIDRGAVKVTLRDAFELLKRAYEQDREWLASPKEVANHYAGVPVPVLADDFDGASLDPAWVADSGQTQPVANGVLKLIPNNSLVDPDVGLRQTLGATLGTTWTATMATSPMSTAPTAGIEIQGPGGAIVAAAYLVGNTFSVQSRDAAGSNVIDVFSITDGKDGARGAWTIQLARQGRWLCAYANGLRVGAVPWQSTDLGSRVKIIGNTNPGSTEFLAVASIVVKDHQALVARGSDLGDFVLPGDQPTGGLVGRYYSGSDVQGISAANRAARILAPGREQYGERLDPIIDTAGGLSLPLLPGAASNNAFAVRWHGSVYLRGDLGNYTFEATSVEDGVMLWVGDTRYANPILNAWGSSVGTQSGVWNAANHGSKAGWYPIILEYLLDAGTPAIRLQFTPPSTGYTDQGGTTITASTKRVIPATSLSPTGCFDNRVQGTSHFEVLTSAAAQAGYQLTCEPMEPESGEFPGRVVPRLRVGRDTDLTLVEDVDDHGDPLLAPGVSLDGSEQVTSLRGFGAGQANGNGSQVAAEINDMAGMKAALFDLQGTIDAADIASKGLMAGRLSSELEVRGPVWEEVRGTPRGQEQLADTWPLSGVLSEMHWRPGDGIRLVLKEIGVEDLTPRQMVQVTRQFTAEARTGTQVAFRQRPRSAGRSIRTLMRSAIASQRSYQGQTVTREGAYISAASVAASGFTDYSRVALFPQDRVVSAKVRIVYNSASQALDLEINNTLRASVLGGTWSLTPTTVDVRGYATQVATSLNEFYVRVKNTGGSPTAIEFQLIVEVEA